MTENKSDIVMRLKVLLKATRAGSDIEDLILNETETKDSIMILFRHGGRRVVDVSGDSGVAIIKDVINRL